MALANFGSEDTAPNKVIEEWNFRSSGWPSISRIVRPSMALTSAVHSGGGTPERGGRGRRRPHRVTRWQIAAPSRCGRDRRAGEIRTTSNGSAYNRPAIPPGQPGRPEPVHPRNALDRSGQSWLPRLGCETGQPIEQRSLALKYLSGGSGQIEPFGTIDFRK